MTSKFSFKAILFYSFFFYLLPFTSYCNRVVSERSIKATFEQSWESLCTVMEQEDHFLHNFLSEIIQMDQKIPTGNYDLLSA